MIIIKKNQIFNYLSVKIGNLNLARFLNNIISEIQAKFLLLKAASFTTLKIFQCCSTKGRTVTISATTATPQHMKNNPENGLDPIVLVLPLLFMFGLEHLH